MRPLFTDEWAIVGTIDPDQGAVASPEAELLSDEIDMSDYDQVAFILSVGAISAAGGTLDFKIQQAATAGGTYKDVTNAAATQLTGSPSDNNKQVVIVVNQEDLDLDNNFRYVKARIFPGGSGNIDYSVLCLGRAKKGPASDGDLASVDEIVDP